MNNTATINSSAGSTNVKCMGYVRPGEAASPRAIGGKPTVRRIRHRSSSASPSSPRSHGSRPDCVDGVDIPWTARSTPAQRRCRFAGNPRFEFQLEHDRCTDHSLEQHHRSPRAEHSGRPYRRTAQWTASPYANPGAVSNFIRSVAPRAARDSRVPPRNTASTRSSAGTVSDNEVIGPLSVANTLAATEPVKTFETSGRDYFCRSVATVGLLIHATVGSFGGVGRRPQNRRGLAA
jgi:hypothetical protein